MNDALDWIALAALMAAVYWTLLYVWYTRP